MVSPPQSLSPRSTREESTQQPPAAAPQPPAEKKCVYKIKTIQILGRDTQILMQDKNGPCPLLAICNVLLLRNDLDLSPDISEVSQGKLLSLIAERFIDKEDAGYVQNQKISDVFKFFHRLTTGVAVDLTFNSINGFKPTPESKIFGLVGIPLYHGWIVDPQDFQTANAIGSKSYDALQNDLVIKKDITPQQGNLINKFLKSNASQLTIYGLDRLKISLEDNETCVLFRNNHFRTMFKYGGELYLLVTDEGYIHQSDLVFEKFNEVKGNVVFMTGNLEFYHHVADPQEENNAMTSTADPPDQKPMTSTADPPDQKPMTSTAMVYGGGEFKLPTTASSCAGTFKLRITDLGKKKLFPDIHKEKDSTGTVIKESKKFILIDEEGERYEVHYLVHENIISKGWSRFAKEHNIQLGDVVHLKRVKEKEIRFRLTKGGKEKEAKEGGDGKAVEEGGDSEGKDGQVIVEFEPDSYVAIERLKKQFSQLSEDEVSKYQDMCLYYKSVFHANVVGTEQGNAIGLLVNVVSRIRACTLETTEQDLQHCKEALTYLQQAGMTIALVLAEVERVISDHAKSRKLLRSQEDYIGGLETAEFIELKRRANAKFTKDLLSYFW